jgi:hypothetical protein
MKKKLLRLSFVTTVAALLSSCFGTDSKIAEVDLIPVSNGKEYQYIDREGKISINPQFSVATVFRNELALVKTSGDYSKQSWGYIDGEGKYAINARYMDATVFSEEISWVVEKNGAPTALNTKGDTLFVLEQAESVRIFKEGLAAFNVEEEDGENNWGFVDASGIVKINPQFQYVKNFSEGMSAFRNEDGEWGYINREGKIVINPQFDSADDFVEDRAVVTLDDQYGIIDKNGKFLVNPQFDMAKPDGDNYLVKEGDKWGWCDYEGKMIINPQFDDAFPFGGKDYAPVKSAGEYGFVDIEGKFIINPQFKAAVPFNGNLAMVSSAGKIGLIDQEGKYVVNPQFEKVSSDYVDYITYGTSRYESVNSDYFDIEAVNSAVSFESPAGIPLNSTFAEIAESLNYTFRKNDYYYKIIDGEKINKKVSYSLFVHGNAFKKVEVKKGSGYYSYISTEKVFDGEAKPTSFTFSFSVTDYDLILEILRKKIITEGYEKVTNPDGPDRAYEGGEIEVYRGKDKELKIYMAEGNAYLEIIPNIES